MNFVLSKSLWGSPGSVRLIGQTKPFEVKLHHGTDLVECGVAQILREQADQPRWRLVLVEWLAVSEATGEAQPIDESRVIPSAATTCATDSSVPMYVFYASWAAGASARHVYTHHG